MSLCDSNAAPLHPGFPQSSIFSTRTLPPTFPFPASPFPALLFPQHGLYQRTPEQIPEGSWGRGMVTLAGEAHE